MYDKCCVKLNSKNHKVGGPGDKFDASAMLTLFCFSKFIRYKFNRSDQDLSSPTAASKLLNFCWPNQDFSNPVDVLNPLRRI